jgi:hypothetical protein
MPLSTERLFENPSVDMTRAVGLNYRLSEALINTVAIECTRHIDTIYRVLDLGEVNKD